jgi:hypothetical protein
LLRIVGVMSANLGAMLLVGFALGDFLLAHPDWSHLGGLVSHLWRVRVPLLIKYNLLGLLVVGIPLFTKALLAPLAPPAGRNRQVSFGIALLGHLLLTAVLVYFWAQTVPILIRPVFTWVGGLPSPAAIVPLQQRWRAVVVAAALASLARMVLQGRTVFRSEPGAQVYALQTQITSAAPVTPATQRLPPWARVSAHTLWSTVLLSGMFKSWLDALLLGALIWVIQAARAGIVSVPLGPWPALVERVPLLFRLVLGFVILYLSSEAILPQQIRPTDSFRLFVVLTGVGMVILYLLAPGVPAAQPRKGGPA